MSEPTEGSAVGECSRFKISETILKTGQLDAMKPWYRTVLGVDPFFEHAPPEASKPGDFGGQTRASDLRMCFFRLSAAYPYTQVVGLFEEPGTATTAAKGAPGLHHMQLMSENVAELIEKYDSLALAGLHPHRSANHGPFTSFYYRDPDGEQRGADDAELPDLSGHDRVHALAGVQGQPFGRGARPGGVRGPLQKRRERRGAGENLRASGSEGEGPVVGARRSREDSLADLG